MKAHRADKYPVSERTLRRRWQRDRAEMKAALQADPEYRRWQRNQRRRRDGRMRLTMSSNFFARWKDGRKADGRPRPADVRSGWGHAVAGIGVRRGQTAVTDISANRFLLLDRFSKNGQEK